MKATENKRPLNKKLAKGIIKFLEDKPICEDEFGSQSHSNIAKSLYSIINKQIGGKAIALIGKWGSGKSCVIEMLKKKVEINKKDNIAIFVFDSWEHEGDPLRRSFLEKLLNYLESKRWLIKKYDEEKEEEVFDNDDIQEIYKKLFERYTREIINTTPILRPEGKVFGLLMAILYPMGIGIISNILNFCKFFNIHSIYYLYAIAISLTGILLMILPFGYLEIKYQQAKRKGIQHKSIFSLIFSKTVEEQIVEKFESPDPTSLEFEKSYNDIIKTILEKKRRKLLIVIDNLDRVGTDTALKLLSTIKPFIQVQKSDNQEIQNLFERVWYIIPFDSSGLKRLWGEKKNKDELAKVFIDKTFQIRIYIPDIILVNWQKFFNRKIGEIGINDAEKRYTIRRIFEILYKSKPSKENKLNQEKQDKKTKQEIIPSSPTPREIKLFINNFVESILQRAEDDISFKYHTIFTAIRDYYPDIYREFHNKIISGDLPQKNKLELFLGKDWQKNLAALYFNVSPKDALHVLLWNKVEFALSIGDKEFFTYEKETPGIVEVTQTILASKISEWSKNEPYKIGYALYSLPKDFPERIFKDIKKKIPYIKSLNGIDKKSAQGIIKLIEITSPDEKFLERLLNSISKAIPVPISESENGEIE